MGMRAVLLLSCLTVAVIAAPVMVEQAAPLVSGGVTAPANAPEVPPTAAANETPIQNAAIPSATESNAIPSANTPTTGESQAIQEPITISKQDSLENTETAVGVTAAIPAAAPAQASVSESAQMLPSLHLNTGGVTDFLNPYRKYILKFKELNNEKMYMSNALQDTLASSFAFDASRPYSSITPASSATHSLWASTPMAFSRTNPQSEKSFDFSSPHFNLLKIGRKNVLGSAETKKVMHDYNSETDVDQDTDVRNLARGVTYGNIVDGDGYVLPAEELATATSSFSSTTSDASADYYLGFRAATSGTTGIWPTFPSGEALNDISEVPQRQKKQK